MKITRQADYAIRTILYLSKLEPNELVSTHRIAHEQHIPLSFLAKIISQLSLAGLLQTTRGARGGVTLAKPAAKITLLEVVEAIDGPILLNQCVDDEHACNFGQECPLQPVWCNAQSELVQRLSETNFGLFTTLNYKNKNYVPPSKRQKAGE